MNFVSILKKIGLGVAQATGIYEGYKPLITAVAPQVGQHLGDGLELAAKIVLDAEIMGAAIGAPGSQKAAMLAGPMFQLLLDLPVLRGKKPKDPEDAKLKAQKVGADIADFLNCFEE